MERVFHAMRKLPASTDSWACPWFWGIMWFGVCAAVAGFLNGTTLGIVWGAAAALIVLNVLVRRRRGVVSCRI